MHRPRQADSAHMPLSCMGLSSKVSKERVAFVFCFILYVCEHVYVFVCLMWHLHTCLCAGVHACTCAEGRGRDLGFCFDSPFLV